MPPEELILDKARLIKQIKPATISETNEIQIIFFSIINLLIIRIPLEILMKNSMENLTLGIPAGSDNFDKVHLDRILW